MLDYGYHSPAAVRMLSLLSWGLTSNTFLFLISIWYCKMLIFYCVSDVQGWNTSPNSGRCGWLGIKFFTSHSEFKASLHFKKSNVDGEVSGDKPPVLLPEKGCRVKPTNQTSERQSPLSTAFIFTSISRQYSVHGFLLSLAAGQGAPQLHLEGHRVFTPC